MAKKDKEYKKYLNSVRFNEGFLNLICKHKLSDDELLTFYIHNICGIIHCREDCTKAAQKNIIDIFEYAKRYLLESYQEINETS